MNEIAAALEATALAQHLKASRWTYPLVNAGHILGLAVLIGAVVPMDLRLLRGDATVLWLRRYAAGGLVIAVTFGAMLFITQATDYLSNRWFLAKMSVLALALANIAAHPRLSELPPDGRQLVALLSLSLWPIVLVLGRMIAFA
ncbi:hypothetical protein [Roseitranquillus sediminis]|uniref:hypothetical protein n=1 Tax=Roseitranquillus sediminis TaxID=2809051 RepID=UPI001D0BFF9D|nr:hypothetical protein [Roseitranquillus sediminis]MBM9594991.1 hypothetical protein [Roseitranquillus sediminis]